MIIILLTLIGSVSLFGINPIPANAAGALPDNASKWAKQSSSPPSDQKKSDQNKTVQNQTTRMHLFQQSISWFGQVESRHAVQLVSRVAGRIVSLNVKDEANVHAGEILFELAGTAVESQITDLKQQRHQSDREFQIAQKNLQLIRSKKQQHLATNEQVNAAKNALAQAKIRISRVRQSLISLASGIRIIAPADGVFTARSVQVGQYIKAGTRLARIVDVHHFRIRATLFPPANITSLVGQHAVIHGSHGDITGTVTAMMPETTAEGGMQVWIHAVAQKKESVAQNKGAIAQNVEPAAQKQVSALHKLRPGMQLSGNILLPHRSLAVPSSAIARDDAGHAFVFIRDGNRWRKQQIITGIRDQQWVEIRSGLRAGDQVASEDAYEMLYRNFSSTYHEPD